MEGTEHNGWIYVKRKSQKGEKKQEKSPNFYFALNSIRMMKSRMKWAYA
jgi:hypothetical protein